MQSKLSFFILIYSYNEEENIKEGIVLRRLHAFFVDMYMGRLGLKNCITHMFLMLHVMKLQLEDGL